MMAGLERMTECRSVARAPLKKLPTHETRVDILVTQRHAARLFKVKVQHGPVHSVQIGTFGLQGTLHREKGFTSLRID